MSSSPSPSTASSQTSTSNATGSTISWAGNCSRFRSGGAAFMVGAQSSSSPVIRIAAVGDLHCTRTSQGALQTLFSQVSDAADMLLLAGDLTDTGLADEARILARELAALHVPAIAVFGNHDCESGHQDEVRTILTDAGVTMLDGEATEVRGVGIAGVKGFCGGFGKRALGP